MKLYIKYMVSLRCRKIVADELNALGLEYKNLELGSVDLADNPPEEKLQILRRNLLATGLEVLDDKKNILIEKIKAVVVEMIHYMDELPKTNYSVYISEKLQYDYTYLSNIFSEVKGITLQHYIISHKIEKVKELLLYDELSLTQIAEKMHYSSVGHLSNQFKKVTGLTPSFFKRIKKNRDQNLENI